jgi:hypothetical protein
MLTDLATQLFRMDLVDPTPDGILTRIVNFAIAALMVLVALVGAWKAFQAWSGAPAAAGGAGGAGGAKAPAGTGGGSAEMKKLRDVVFGVVVVEAILGGILILANYGTRILPSLGIS